MCNVLEKKLVCSTCAKKEWEILRASSYADMILFHYYSFHKNKLINQHGYQKPTFIFSCSYIDSKNVHLRPNLVNNKIHQPTAWHSDRPLLTVLLSVAVPYFLDNILISLFYISFILQLREQIMFFLNFNITETRSNKKYV